MLNFWAHAILRPGRGWCIPERSVLIPTAFQGRHQLQMTLPFNIRTFKLAILIDMRKIEVRVTDSMSGAVENRAGLAEQGVKGQTWCMFRPFLSAMLICCFWLLTSLICHAQQSKNIRLLDHWFSELPATNHRESRYNDMWAFTHGGEEYAVIGSTIGSHIIHLPYRGGAREVAFIPGEAQGSHVIHRDYAVYDHFLYAVCDQQPSGFQVIDFSGLPHRVDVVHDSNNLFSTAHNVFTDQCTGKLYVCGPSGHALTVLDAAANPANPPLIRHFDDVEYVHDVYVRCDTAFLHSAEEGLVMVDFQNPEAPVLLGTLNSYPDQGYNHSGWLNERGDIYVFTDETPGMRLKVCNAENLNQLEVQSLLSSNGAPHSMPHNVVVEGDLAFVAYYFDGLQVFDISDPENPERIAWYRTYDGPEEDYRGAWGVHKGLPSGRILVSDRHTGLYVFALTEEEGISNNDELVLFPNPGGFRPVIHVRRRNFITLSHRAFTSQGKLVDEGDWRARGDAFWFPVDLSSQTPGLYLIEVQIDDGTPEVFKYLLQDTERP